MLCVYELYGSRVYLVIITGKSVFGHNNWDFEEVHTNEGMCEKMKFLPRY